MWSWNRRPSGSGLKLWPFWTELAAVVLFSDVVAIIVGLVLWYVLGRPPVARHAPLNVTGLLDLTRVALVVTGGIGGVVALVAYRQRNGALLKLKPAADRVTRLPANDSLGPARGPGVHHRVVPCSR